MEIIIDILKGTASIVIVLIPLLIPQVREFVIKKYQNSLDKALEDRKAGNERRNYVSKVRFDKEFKIYATLSEQYNTLAYNIATYILVLLKVPDIIPPITLISPKELMGKMNVFQCEYNKYAPFISNTIYEKIDEMYLEMDILFALYKWTCCFKGDEKQSYQKPALNISFGEKTRDEVVVLFETKGYEIHNRRKELNSLIRKHLENLEVKE